MSRLLARVIGLDILKVFTLVLLIQLVIFGSISTIQASRDYGFDLALLLPIFWIVFGYCLYYAIPIALLFAAGLVFGRMIADREVDAFRSFGISHAEMIVAPAVLGIVASIGCFFINGYLVPQLRFAKDNLGRLLLNQLRYMEDGYDKSFFLPNENGEKTTRIVIVRYSQGKLYNVFLFAEEPREIFGSLPGDVSLGETDADEEDDGATDDERGGTRQGRRSPRLRDAAIDATAYPLILNAAEGEVIARVEDGTERLFLELRRVELLFDPNYDDVSLPPLEAIEDGGRPPAARRRSEAFHQIVRLARVPLPLGDFDEDKRSRKGMTNPTLLRFASKMLEESRDERLSAKERRTARNLHRKSWTLYHKRLTFALISLTFPVVAALIALSLNSTNRLLPFFVGTVVCCLVFFPLEVQGSEIGWQLDLPWLEHLGNAVLLALGGVLYLRLEKRWPFVRSRRRAAAGHGTGGAP